MNRVRYFLLIPLTAWLALPCAAQTSSASQRTSRAFTAARQAGAPALYAFLKPFPKGADLHMHLSGAVYAETFIAEAVKAGLWVGQANPGIPPGPMSNGTLCFQSPPEVKPLVNKACGTPSISVADAIKSQTTYDALIDSFSLRSFVPSPGWSGHDQFFATFDRFGGIRGTAGEWLDEVATRAAAQNEQYLEIMQTPGFGHVFSAIAKAPWPADFRDQNHMQVLAAYRDALLTNGLREDVALDQQELTSALASRESLENCHTGASTAAACGVRIHFLYQVLRGFPPAQVFAQTLLGFELATAHPDDVVGMNFVRAEDRMDAMAEYHTEMLMLDYLHSVYPKVHITLHAGELAPGIVPPAGLSFHIREAIDLGHAERIGHGVDVLYEDRPQELLKEMAAKHIDVEINLVSNEGILGVTGSRHPLAAYRAAHVPFSLSTDDEGVSRTDLTHNYVQAVLDQGLSYADLKQSARASLEHSFLHGVSLWVAVDNFSTRTAACAAIITVNSVPSTACKAFLDGSERAAQQWDLERRFAAFESAAH